MEKNVSDELLTRWMCGEATPEEEAQVLDYLSENDERIDDLRTMVAATQLDSNNAFSQPKKKNVLRISLAIAASVALVICLTIPLWRTDTPQPSLSATEHTLHTEEAPSYATYDTINDDAI